MIIGLRHFCLWHFDSDNNSFAHSFLSISSIPVKIFFLLLLLTIWSSGFQFIPVTWFFLHHSDEVRVVCMLTNHIATAGPIIGVKSRRPCKKYVWISQTYSGFLLAFRKYCYIQKICIFRKYHLPILNGLLAMWWLLLALGWLPVVVLHKGEVKVAPKLLLLYCCSCCCCCCCCCCTTTGLLVWWRVALGQLLVVLLKGLL